MLNDKVVYKELSYLIIGVLFEVYNELGYGYKEKHIERAVAVEFYKRGIIFFTQVPYKVKYKKEIVGTYYLDFLVDNKIVLELKQGRYFSKQNIFQVKEYLKITGKKLAILANFMPTGVKFIRVLNPNNI
ncbi:MAG: GxxExxY protein [Patescibacteria group bacterium]|jgi:GxxExxY protein